MRAEPVIPAERKCCDQLRDWRGMVSGTRDAACSPHPPGAHGVVERRLLYLKPDPFDNFDMSRDHRSMVGLTVF